MKTIPLTQGYRAIVDDEDYDELSQYNWQARVATSTGTAYAARIATVGGKRTSVIMHRLLLDAPKGLTVDHINGDALDNRRDNLRICTLGQNQWNRGAKRGSASRYKGVSAHKGRWRARINVGGREISAGYYDSEEDAARAYDEAARKHVGELAWLNFPAEGEKQFDFGVRQEKEPSAKEMIAAASECPFCGHHPRLETKSPDGVADSSSVRIACRAKSCRVAPSTPWRTFSFRSADEHGKRKASAVESSMRAWDQRPAE